ncbi:MAG: site-specific DNA-methyltransferase [Bifidobacteriaceae bacterium]|jgi:DNA modification methylase|nr:site-specific DNA-methyltransferase [Bifidobacteriaceae bacterium]
MTPSSSVEGASRPVPLRAPQFVTVDHVVGANYRRALDHSALVCGDALAVMSSLPPESVQAVVTSPPYWSLRDYGISGQIGLEESVYSFVSNLADVFDQVFRVLRRDGTLWLNIGDSYTSGNRGWRAPDKKNPARAMSLRPPTPEGLKDKDLIGVPWRLALAMQEHGWYLRSEVIWRKPNAQPESVRDRPTRDHEQLFLFSRSERYKYHVDAVKGPGGRRLRTVWDISTKPSRAAAGHFATFPAELVERCLRIGTDVGDLVLDPFLGSGTTALVAGALGRRFLGIELHPDYLAMSRSRLLDEGFIDATPKAAAGHDRQAGHRAVV